MKPSEEKDNLKAISLGDIDAFEKLFFQYQPKLVYFITGLIHDEEMARDMSQDIFLSLFEDRAKLSEVISFSSYLYKIARCCVYNYYDHQLVCQKYMAEQLLSVSDYHSLEEELFVKELQVLLFDKVERMPSQRQRVFKMSRIEGLSNDEIALRLNISKRTVENHITTVLADLKKVLHILLLLNIIH
jgi:RNA polymerase sigma-70 factor (family 1)